jgi:HD-like signal output (HDOD) protein
MSTVAVNQLKEGMVSSDEVRDINGRLLLGAGIEIKATHINVFKKWGVAAVSIDGQNNSPKVAETDIDPELFERASENVKDIFRHVDLSHPFIKELFRLSVLHRIKTNAFEPNQDTNVAESENLKTVKKVDLRAKLAEKEIKLPEIPAIVAELNQVIDDPESSADDIARVVNKSPSLVATLLRIVNSSFYSFHSEIDSISRAVALIGASEISTLAIGISVISVFKSIPKKTLDMRAFLKHSLACGLLSRIIAAHNNILQTEQCFVAGLLHDIGRVVIYKDFSSQAKVLFERRATSHNLLYWEEKIHFGCQHTDIGKILLKRWNLPDTLGQRVFYHHNPSGAQEPVQPLIVHLADLTVNGLGLGSSGERFVPQFDDQAADRLAFSPLKLEMIINQALHQFSTLASFLGE